MSVLSNEINEIIRGIYFCVFFFILILFANNTRQMQLL